MVYNPTLEPQDYVILAGQRSPGICEIANADILLRWVKRRGYGLSYGTAIYRGAELAEPVLTLRLIEDQDWKDWEAFRPLVSKPPQGERARAMDIDHPFLAAAGIRSVTVQSVSQPKPVGEQGEYAITIKLLEFHRPEFALARPTSSEPQQLTALEQRIQERLVVFNYERGLSGGS